MGLLLALTSAVLGVGGCAADARHRVLSLFFDGVRAPVAPPPADGPVVGGTPTAPGLPEPPSAGAPSAGLPTYAELAEALPRDVRGNLDWVQAAEKGLIAPRPSIDPRMPALPELPMDVLLDPGVPNFQVVFPHEAHTYWLHCSSCHPAIFEMKAGANDISMAKIFQGEFCGQCHGKVAFAPANGCPRCHVQSGL